MKAFSIAIVVALTSVTALPAMAFETDFDTEIHGRSAFAVESALRDRGIAATSVEEWGGLVRAWVREADGSMSMEFFDAHTLQPTTFPQG